MARLVLLTLPLWAAGCVAVRYTPHLDSSPSAAAESFLAEASVSVEVVPGYGGYCTPELAQPRDDASRAIRIVQNSSESWPGRGFQCFEPLLSVLTIGIVPADCRNHFEFVAEIESESASESVSTSYQHDRIAGWVAFLLPIFPGWEYGFNDKPCERALYKAAEQYLEHKEP